jgi:hypothetical protein
MKKKIETKQINYSMISVQLQQILFAKIKHKIGDIKTPYSYYFEYLRFLDLISEVLNMIFLVSSKLKKRQTL